MSYSIRLPISVLGFYLFLLSLIFFGIIPTIPEIVVILKNIYYSFGLFGLFIASFLEGLAYVGLYFPGSLIIAIAAMFCDGTFFSLSMISLVVALALTVSNLINYYFGKYSFLNKFLKPKEEKEIVKTVKKKGFWLSFIHPNSLGFYFYTIGAKKKSLKSLFIVPIVMFFYGLALAYLFYFLRNSIREMVENPYVMVSVLSVWFCVALIVNYLNSRKGNNFA